MDAGCHGDWSVDRLQHIFLSYPEMRYLQNDLLGKRCWKENVSNPLIQIKLFGINSGCNRVDMTTADGWEKDGLFTEFCDDIGLILIKK